MSTLYGRKPAETFGSLLKVRKNTDNISGVTLPGVTSTLSAVEDGLGNATPLKVSSSRLAFNDLVWPTVSGTVGATLVIGENGQLEWSSTPATVSAIPWTGITNTPTTRAGYGITDAQPLDGDLTAIAGLAGNFGFLKKTATNTWVLDDLQASFAPLASPAFTGTPTAPTAAVGTSTTQLATTKFVSDSFATKSSPSFTGIPTAPTAAVGTSNTQLATTKFVSDGFLPISGGRITGVTDSTSKDTGSLILEGGLGVEKSIVSGGMITTTNGVKFADGTVQSTASVSQVPVNITYVSSTGVNAFGMLVDGRVYVTQSPVGTYDAYSSGSSSVNGSGIRGMANLSEIPIPTETSPIVECFISHAINWALTETGKLYVWGYNGQGQLGLGHTNNVNVPTLSATNVVKVYCDNEITNGYNHTLCRMVIKKTDGNIYVTGYNGFGALGLGDTVDRTSWTLLSAAGQNPLYVGNLGPYVGALVIQKADKTIWVAGYNSYGQLGTGFTAPSVNSLTNVTNAWTGGNTNMLIKKVTGGFGYSDDSSFAYTSIAMWLDDGTTSQIRTCGNNNWGQLGTGNTTGISTPALVVNKTGAARPVQVEWHSGVPGGILYVDGSNNLYGWGYNSYGQLATGTFAAVGLSTPTLMMSGVNRILLCRASATYSYRSATFVEDVNGVVWATGYNTHCELGIGEYGDKSGWQRVRFPNGVRIKQMGQWASTPTGNIQVAVATNNTIYAWGYNGQYSISSANPADIQIPMVINANLVR